MWCFSFVAAVLSFFLLFCSESNGIILPNEEQPKPPKTTGIKTTHWRPNPIQTHHNYSKVYANSPDGHSQYVVSQTERTQKVYPVYNAHAYGDSQGSQGQEGVYPVNPEGQGHFASLVGGNSTEVSKSNRTVYKRKIHFKTVDVYEKCPEGATGQFVYNLNCNQFLNCWKGRGQPQNCSPGTLFNPKTLECDYPDKVECITGPRENTLEGVRFQKSTVQAFCPKEFSGLIPNYTDCSKFINCNNGQQNSMDCPPGTLFDINQNVCDFAYKTTCFNGGAGTSQEGGQYYQGQSSSQYGTAHKHLDAHGQHQGQSYYGPYVQGQHSISSKLDFGKDQISSSSNQYYSQTNCHQSSMGCNKGFGQDTYSAQTNIRSTTCNPQVQNCGNTPHTSFGYSQGQNSWCNPQTQNCHNYIRQQTTTQRYGFGNEPTAYRTCNEQNNYCGRGKFAYEASYSEGQVTAQGQGQGQVGGNTNYNKVCNINDPNCHRNQNTGASSHSKEPKCPSSYQGIMKHPTDCAKFLNCANGLTFVQSCGPGTLFNPSLNVCDFPYNVKCTNTEDNLATTITPESQVTSSQGYTRYQGPGGYNQGQWDSSQGQNNQDRYNQGVNVYNQGQGGSFQSQSTTTPESQVTSSQDPGGYNQSQLDYSQGQNRHDRYNQGVNVYNGGQGSSSQGQNSHNQGRDRYNQGQVGYSQGHGIYPQGQGTDRFNQGYGTHVQGQNHHNQGQSGYDQGGTGYFQGQGGHSQGQDRYNQGQGTYSRGQNNFNRGQGQEINSQAQDRYGHGGSHSQGGSGNFGYITPKPGHVTILSREEGSYDQTTLRDINRGQIGVVSRPNVNNQDFDQAVNSFPDYPDVVGPNRHTTQGIFSTSPRSVWPPPYPSTDVNADYVYEYEDGEPVTLGPENVFYAHNEKKTECTGSDFYCTGRSCVSPTMVCDGRRDCDNGKDEKYCEEYLRRFEARKNYRLDVLETQRWMNVTYTTCAFLCIESKLFHCRSFNYREKDRACHLTDSNVGISGALQRDSPYDYYELKSATINCTNGYKCRNGKCIMRAELCDGVDDCGTREDEKGCKPKDFGYSIKLAGSTSDNEGRIEVSAFGRKGYICDDRFGILDANVICRELGFALGAAEVKGNSYYAKDLKETNTQYLVDDLDCLGNETTLMDCAFSGWGVHNCLSGEIAGVLCKTPEENCGKDYWRCSTGNECVPLSFVCDGLYDCTDSSDEGANCEAPTEMRLVNGTSNKEGRIEIKHHGIWGTICDDDFNDDAGKIVCKYLGFKGVIAVKKDSYFGRGDGPIWLDQVSCYGNETELSKCTHWDWGAHNCDHGEDVGVICSNVYDAVDIQRHSKVTSRYDTSTRPSSIAAISCGFRKDNQFLKNDLIHARVVSGSIAKKGDYPWQAALRVKGKGKAVHWCGAVVISSKWVLTAAHCLQGYAKGAYVIVAGEYNTDDDEGTEQQKYIEEYFIHEDFRKGHKMNNDIALIKLKNQLVLNEDVQPICLPDTDADYERELNCTISGFGSVKTGTSAYSHDMRAAWIPIHNKDTCRMPHVYGTAITEGMICAGFLDGGVDACDGDSGGPLACLNDGLFTLYGLTSWGHHCGYANKPGVYVKVSHYRRWIDDIISKH